MLWKLFDFDPPKKRRKMKKLPKISRICRAGLLDQSMLLLDWLANMLVGAWVPEIKSSESTLLALRWKPRRKIILGYLFHSLRHPKPKEKQAGKNVDERYETVGRLNITVDKSVGKLMVMVDEKFPSHPLALPSSCSFRLLAERRADEEKSTAKREMDE